MTDKDVTADVTSDSPGQYHDIYYLLGKAELARDGRYQMSGTARKHYKEQVARHFYFWPAWLELAEIYWLKMHDLTLHHAHGVTHKSSDRALVESVIELLPGEHVFIRRSAATPRHHVLYFMNALRVRRFKTDTKHRLTKFRNVCCVCTWRPYCCSCSH